MAVSEPASVAAGTTRRREATRQRLLDAAALVFAEVGLAAASVEAVCERAGFTRGAFYSNFDTKEELFLELSGRVARGRLTAVRERIAALERQGALAALPADPLELIRQAMEPATDDRLSVLLLSEIRLHALRTPETAAAYLVQDAELRASVAQILADIAGTGAVAFRVPADEAAGLMLTVWQDASVRAVMAGADEAEVRRLTNAALARVAGLLIAPAAQPTRSSSGRETRSHRNP